MKKERREEKAIFFLIVSLIVVTILIVGLFTMLSAYLNKKSSETIEEVGKVYMTGMNEQIVLHYETTISLRLSQISAIADTNIPGGESREELLQELEYSARARGFSYLALYSENGSVETIYGHKVDPIDPEPFLQSLEQKKEKIAVAMDPGGDRVVLMGVPYECEMADGGKSTALVGGLSAEYMSTLLFLDENMAGLNPAETEEAIKLIRRINESGVTILLIEHIMRAVVSLCEEVIVLHHGEKIASGTPKQVMNDPYVMEVYLGTKKEDAHA